MDWHRVRWRWHVARRASLTRKDEGGVADADSLPSSPLHKPWMGIVLGTSEWEKYNKHDTYVLVVQQEGEQRSGQMAATHAYYERVVLIKLGNCTLVDEILERRTWRLS